VVGDSVGWRWWAAAVMGGGRWALAVAGWWAGRWAGGSRGYGLWVDGEAEVSSGVGGGRHWPATALVGGGGRLRWQVGDDSGSQWRRQWLASGWVAVVS